jgi:hypothetical protein
VTKVRRPEWPVDQLVTFELRDYRLALEQALGSTPETQSAERTELQQRLNEVIAQQTRRREAEHAPVE